MKLFIEIDHYQPEHVTTMESLFGCKFPFDEIIEGAAYRGQELVEKIAIADEIYIDSALIDLSGTLLENMCYHAVENKWTGKKLFIFREFDGIYFNNLHHTANLIDVFSTLGNELYVVDDTTTDYVWQLVDVVSQIERF